MTAVADGRDGTATAPPARDVLRPHVEQVRAGELAALADADDRPRPPGWALSPQAVVTFLLGGETGDGTPVEPKYVGDRRLVEVAVATLATDRALLLLGVPGTAKTWVSEHLCAAVSGDSTLLVQGTAGTTEEAVRYGWDYARLLAHGPSPEALVPSPVMRAMQTGRLVRVEELSRMPGEVQDALLTVLSEGVLPVPELADEVQAVRGFGLVATANDRDRGVNEMSAALRRRFNTVVLPLPRTEAEEVDIVSTRVAARSSCRPSRRRWRRSAASCRSSASCAPGSPRTGGPRCAGRRRRCPAPRRSACSSRASAWPRTSATAPCAPTTWPAR